MLSSVLALLLLSFARQARPGWSNDQNLWMTLGGAA
ncbi:Uncharacterised protein [Mycobacteroides abscessus subsp. abscessus]|nr:Uncharacterised protein [Mycobacteroides abscessus subsp. abscessus]SHW91484.1 Uncharacterised protein [Mycobacteroides abscessus subsp. abscessus]SII38890.1 Uncharacterised protein [Mycobacteroides abscessus subsp. abscessus]SIJ51411.1 Uncharacterised protein [Mycobacteroides abscessus subsp. abscessus]SKQ52271.1 Uncharacterised protein [Mycobacteroides abscessus subsp. abscessus]